MVTGDRFLPEQGPIRHFQRICQSLLLHLTTLNLKAGLLYQTAFVAKILLFQHYFLYLPGQTRLQLGEGIVHPCCLLIFYVRYIFSSMTNTFDRYRFKSKFVSLALDKAFAHLSMTEIQLNATKILPAMLSKLPNLTRSK